MKIIIILYKETFGFATPARNIGVNNNNNTIIITNKLIIIIIVN